MLTAFARNVDSLVAMVDMVLCAVAVDGSERRKTMIEKLKNNYQVQYGHRKEENNENG